MKRIISITLVSCMLFALPVSAQNNFDNLNINSELQKSINELSKNEMNLIKERINKPLLTNLDELSEKNQRIVNETIKEPKNLLLAMVNEKKPILIYNTSNNDIYVTITDENVEVVSYEKDNIMTVNDKDIRYEQKVSYEQEKVVDFNGQKPSYNQNMPNHPSINNNTVKPLLSYVEIPNPGGDWTYITTKHIDNSWHEPLATIGLAVLTTFILRNLGGLIPPGHDYAKALAGSLLGLGVSSQIDSARFTQQQFKHKTRYGTYAYNEQALGKDMKGNYVPTGEWFDRYVASIPIS